MFILKLFQKKPVRKEEDLDDEKYAHDVHKSKEARLRELERREADKLR